MLKIFFLLGGVGIFLFASEVETQTAPKLVEVQDVNSSEKESKRPKEDVIIVKDTSGLSDDELRKRAKDSDTKKMKGLSVTKVVKALDEKGQVDISKIQKKWEELSPTPHQYDWVQTKSKEWFRGKIKALYDGNLEFDSEELGLYTFDFDDIVQIKSYNIISVNIENLASFPGVLRLKDDVVTIIQGDNRYEFSRKDIVSFAPDGEYERNFWSVKATVSLDVRNGNVNQYDYSAALNAQRRTAVSQLSFDYLGRITSQDDTITANNHRLNQKYDMYITRHFFWTPVFSEYYTDSFKNINRQLTLGLGVGYTLIDTTKTTWNLSGGPAFLYTKYDTVVGDEAIDSYSPALELSTKYEVALNKITDITYSYKLTITDEKAGTFSHHMLLTFENELTSWLDLDITGVWDYMLNPQESSEGITPKRSDFQFLLGLGVEF